MFLSQIILVFSALDYYFLSEEIHKKLKNTQSYIMLKMFCDHVFSCFHIQQTQSDMIILLESLGVTTLRLPVLTYVHSTV